MFHYVYITTNNVNGKRYIGKHSFKRIDNRYLGSGHALQHALKKYGRDSFSKQIVQIFETEDEAYQAEFDLINAFNAVKDPLFYNKTLGGRGPESGRTLPANHKQKISAAMFGKKKTETAKKNMSLARKGQTSWHKGRKKSAETVERMKAGRPKNFAHSEETRQKLSEKFSGCNHPAFGMIWVTNGIINRRVGKFFVIECGWRYGKRPYKEV